MKSKIRISNQGISLVCLTTIKDTNGKVYLPSGDGCGPDTRIGCTSDHPCGPDTHKTCPYDIQLLDNKLF
jgi:hypothetical protein